MLRTAIALQDLGFAALSRELHLMLGQTQKINVFISITGYQLVVLRQQKIVPIFKIQHTLPNMQQLEPSLTQSLQRAQVVKAEETKILYKNQTEDTSVTKRKAKRFTFYTFV